MPPTKSSTPTASRGRPMASSFLRCAVQVAHQGHAGAFTVLRMARTMIRYRMPPPRMKIAAQAGGLEMSLTDRCSVAGSPWRGQTGGRWPAPAATWAAGRVMTDMCGRSP